MTSRTLTALAAALVLGAALAPLAPAQTPDFEDLAAAADPYLKPTADDAFLRVAGTLLGGAEDALPVLGAGEYDLVVVGTTRPRTSPDYTRDTLVGGICISTHLFGLKPGATARIGATIPLRSEDDEPFTHIAIGLVERDLVLGSQVLGSTGWLSLADLRAAAPAASRLVMGPTPGGTRLDLAFGWVLSDWDRARRMDAAAE